MLSAAMSTDSTIKPWAAAGWATARQLRSSAVTWTPVPNIAVETSAGVPITGGVLTPPPGSTTAVFYVRKLSGSSATLPLTVTGAFPTWQTFVGGGPSAW